MRLIALVLSDNDAADILAFLRSLRGAPSEGYFASKPISKRSFDLSCPGWSRALVKAEKHRLKSSGSFSEDRLENLHRSSHSLVQSH
jgi:hypothetical protein